MANAEHLAVLKKGVEAWNRWRTEHPAVTPDLRGADLRRAHLGGIDLRDAILSEADLSDAVLSGANLRGAILYKADLSRSDLSHADLEGAILQEASFRGANLSGANLAKVFLHRTDMEGANMEGAVFDGAPPLPVEKQEAPEEKPPESQTPENRLLPAPDPPQKPEIEPPVRSLADLAANRGFLFGPVEDHWHFHLSDPPDPYLQFDGIFPAPFRPNTWQDMLVYVYFGHAQAEVLLDFERRKLLLSGDYSGASGKSQTRIPPDTLLTVMPDIPSVTCNPPSVQFRMTEDYHCLPFRVMHQATPLMEKLGHGRIRGSVRIYLETLLIGGIPVESEWEMPGAVPPPLSPLVASLAAPLVAQAELPGDHIKRQTARQIRKIFASYSHRDTRIIESLEKAYRVLGDDYWRDFQRLRSGQVWSAEIEKAIGDSDIFQLCWSGHAKNSAYVEQEWRAALSRRVENFICPLYWEQPMPAPPEELAHLHFAYYPLDGF